MNVWQDPTIKGWRENKMFLIQIQMMQISEQDQESLGGWNKAEARPCEEGEELHSLAKNFISRKIKDRKTENNDQNTT